MEDRELKNPGSISEKYSAGTESLVDELLGLEQDEIIQMLNGENDPRKIYQAGQLVDLRISETSKGDPIRLKYGMLKKCLNDRRKSIMHVRATRNNELGKIVGKKKEFNV
jgi:hypothetical protein